MGPPDPFLSSEGNHTPHETQRHSSGYIPAGNVTVNHVTHYTTQIRHHTNYTTVPLSFRSPQPRSHMSAMVQSFTPVPPPIPAPGRMIVCDALLPHKEGYVNAPVLCYTSMDAAWCHVYPFIRWMIGDVWHTQRDMWTVELQAVDNPTLAHVARRSDLPLPMVRHLVTALEQSGGGACPDLPRLQQWKNEVHSPFGCVTAKVPCLTCNRPNEVRLAEVRALSDIRDGLTCKMLKRTCETRNPSNELTGDANQFDLLQSWPFPELLPWVQPQPESLRPLQQHEISTASQAQQQMSGYQPQPVSEQQQQGMTMTPSLQQSSQPFRHQPTTSGSLPGLAPKPLSSGIMQNHSGQQQSPWGVVSRTPGIATAQPTSAMQFQLTQQTVATQRDQRHSAIWVAQTMGAPSAQKQEASHPSPQGNSISIQTAVEDVARIDVAQRAAQTAITQSGLPANQALKLQPTPPQLPPYSSPIAAKRASSAAVVSSPPGLQKLDKTRAETQMRKTESLSQGLAAPTPQTGRVVTPTASSELSQASTRKQEQGGCLVDSSVRPLTAPEPETIARHEPVRQQILQPAPVRRGVQTQFQPSALTQTRVGNITATSQNPKSRASDETLTHPSAKISPSTSSRSSGRQPRSQGQAATELLKQATTSTSAHTPKVGSVEPTSRQEKQAEDDAATVSQQTTTSVSEQTRSKTTPTPSQTPGSWSSTEKLMSPSVEPSQPVPLPQWLVELQVREQKQVALIPSKQAVANLATYTAGVERGELTLKQAGLTESGVSTLSRQTTSSASDCGLQENLDKKSEAQEVLQLQCRFRQPSLQQKVGCKSEELVVEGPMRQQANRTEIGQTMSVSEIVTLTAKADSPPDGECDAPLSEEDDQDVRVDLSSNDFQIVLYKPAEMIVAGSMSGRAISNESCAPTSALSVMLPEKNAEVTGVSRQLQESLHTSTDGQSTVKQESLSLASIEQDESAPTIPSTIEKDKWCPLVPSSNDVQEANPERQLETTNGCGNNLDANCVIEGSSSIQIQDRTVRQVIVGSKRQRRRLGWFEYRVGDSQWDEAIEGRILHSTASRDAMIPPSETATGSDAPLEAATESQLGEKGAANNSLGVKHSPGKGSHEDPGNMSIQLATNDLRLPHTSPRPIANRIAHLPEHRSTKERLPLSVTSSILTSSAASDGLLETDELRLSCANWEQGNDRIDYSDEYQEKADRSPPFVRPDNSVPSATPRKLIPSASTAPALDFASLTAFAQFGIAPSLSNLRTASIESIVNRCGEAGQRDQKEAEAIEGEDQASDAQEDCVMLTRFASAETSDVTVQDPSTISAVSLDTLSFRFVLIRSILSATATAPAISPSQFSTTDSDMKSFSILTYLALSPMSDYLPPTLRPMTPIHLKQKRRHGTTGILTSSAVIPSSATPSPSLQKAPHGMESDSPNNVYSSLALTVSSSSATISFPNISTLIFPCVVPSAASAIGQMNNWLSLTATTNSWLHKKSSSREWLVCGKEFVRGDSCRYLEGHERRDDQHHHHFVFDPGGGLESLMKELIDTTDKYVMESKTVNGQRSGRRPPPEPPPVVMTSVDDKKGCG